MDTVERAVSPAYADGPAASLERQHQNELSRIRKWVARLRRKHPGRTCGNCGASGGDHCAASGNLWGNTLLVLTPEAPGCKKWRPA